MKKLLKVLLSMIVVVLLTITALGYIEYRSALAEISLEDKITQIQSKEDYVQIEDVSDYLLKATVTTEDQRFYEHNGIDWLAYGRIGLMLRSVPIAAAAGVTRPPFFKYFKVSTAMNIPFSDFVFSKYILISSADLPSAIKWLASITLALNMKDTF